MRTVQCADSTSVQGFSLPNHVWEITLDMDASLADVQLRFVSYTRITLMSIAERFKDRGLMGAIGAFEPQSIPSSAAARKGYGVGELNVLIDHYVKSLNGVAPVVPGW